MKIDNKIGYLNDDFRIFHIRDKKNIEFEYHHHDFNKIVILVEGDLTYLIEGKSYTLKPWDILFVNNNEIHKPIVNPDKFYERIVIWLSPEFMKVNSKDNSNLLKCFDIALKNQYNLLRLNISSIETIKNLLSQINSNENSYEFGNDILKNALFLQLMVFINRLFINSDKNCEISDIKYDKTIDNVLKYINDNLSSNLSIDKLADEFFTSKYYLMRKFKAHTGSSIHSYIIQKRLILAKSFISKGYIMSDICYMCGFNDYSTFVRAFKKAYGVSPKNYVLDKSTFDSKFSTE